MYDIPFDRSFLQLSNGIRHVMPSTDPKAELTAKASMAQPVSQPAVYANGLIMFAHVCLLWAGKSNREARNGINVWYDVLSATITEPITCSERAVHATNVVVLTTFCVSCLCMA
jgi:hypothetical protein